MKRPTAVRIVPAYDRRQRKRYLTLKNVGKVTLILILVFGVITISSEMRNSKSDDFGRLYGREVKKAPQATPKPIEIPIAAAPVPEDTSADPLLLGAAAREQYLGVTEPLKPVTPPAAVSTVAPGPGGRVAIVGGTEGVAIVKSKDKLPKLGGGFMRPE